MRAKPPKEIDAVVDGVGADGFGTGTLDERQIRIKNALPGEVVRARVLKRRSGEWLAEANLIESASSLRVQPACEYFPRCGGCVMQHMDYPEQLRLKQQQLLDALEQNEVVPGRVVAPTEGPRYHYRTKARLGVRLVGDQVLVGFRESFSNRVARIRTCLILVPSLAELIAPLQTLISGLSCPGRIPQVEVAAGDGSSALILRHLEPLTEQDLALIRQFSDRYHVGCYGQSGGYDTVTPLSGCRPYLGYANEDFGVHYLFRPTDFTQVNLDMNRKLVQAAIAGLSAPDGATVLDLFCGIGNFSLPLARLGYRVRGLEAAADAIGRARTNAAHNRLEGRCEFAVQDLYDAACPDLGDARYMLLDPPRSGAGPNLVGWVRSGGTERIGYVSCSPASFAADARVLAGEGFELEQVGIFDMFPHTAHVETLGVFSKRW